MIRCLNIVMFTVVQENSGNNKDLEDLHVLHEGQVILFGSNPPVQSSLPASIFLAIMFFLAILAFGKVQ